MITKAYGLIVANTQLNAVRPFRSMAFSVSRYKSISHTIRTFPAKRKDMNLPVWRIILVASFFLSILVGQIISPGSPLDDDWLDTMNPGKYVTIFGIVSAVVLVVGFANDWFRKKQAPSVNTRSAQVRDKRFADKFVDWLGRSATWRNAFWFGFVGLLVFVSAEYVLPDYSIYIEPVSALSVMLGGLFAMYRIGK